MRAIRPRIALWLLTAALLAAGCVPVTRHPVATPADVAEEILIPAGAFQMGCDPVKSTEPCPSDQVPLHTVTLDAYAIDKYEVTNARYAQCVDAGACTLPHETSSSTRDSYYANPTYADYPVIQVDRHQAAAFCAWAGKRLPTEAEWEKAARGDSDTREYPWGDAIPDAALANFDGNEGDTTAVGSYPAGASPYGVMDMAGNVYEWTSDWYDNSYYAVSPANNPQGPATGTYVVLRSGSWNNAAGIVRAGARDLGHADDWNDVGGFRCVRSQ